MSIFPIIVSAITAALFVLPFGRPKKEYVETKKANTLLKMAIEAVGKADSEPVGSLVIGLCAISQLMPALIAWQAVDVSPRQNIGGWMLIESIACLAGTVMAFIFMAMTYMGFMWGASSTGRLTFVAFAITALNLLAAVAGIVTAFRPSWLAGLAG